MKTIITSVLTLLFCAAGIFSCSDENHFSDSPNLSLSFSQDTVSFDTVFTSITSVTARLKVYNRNKNALRISSVSLSGNSRSPFRINVSGRQNGEQAFSDIELKGRDSLTIFVRVTLPLNSANNPILFSDSIRFLTNGNTQHVQLQAVGQDAVIFRDKVIESDTALLGEKPYLIFGTLRVAENTRLTIGEGCRLYFHAKSGIEVRGTLEAGGTSENNVLMRGDRLDYLFEGVPYDTLSGQWEGIKLFGGKHILENIEMRSGRTALHLVPTDGGMPEISLINSTIHNFDSCGIAATEAKILAVNTQISNCAAGCVSLQGGDADFTHCTIANFYPEYRRTNAAVVVRNHSDNVPCPTTAAAFRNCIVFGNYENNHSVTTKNEVFLDSIAGADFNVSFDNCFINETSTNLDSHFTNSVSGKKSQPIFVNSIRYPYNFSLTEESPARNAANITIAQEYPTDKNGINRITTDGEPDLGAYEFGN